MKENYLYFHSVHILYHNLLKQWSSQTIGHWQMFSIVLDFRLFLLLPPIRPPTFTAVPFKFCFTKTCFTQGMASIKEPSQIFFSLNCHRCFCNLASSPNPKSVGPMQAYFYLWEEVDFISLVSILWPVQHWKLYRELLLCWYDYQSY